MNSSVYNEKQVRSAYGAYILTYMAEAEGKPPEELINRRSNGDLNRVREIVTQFRLGQTILTEASILLGHGGASQKLTHHDFMAAGRVDSPIILVPTGGYQAKPNYRSVALRKKQRRYFMSHDIDIVIVPRIVH